MKSDYAIIGKTETLTKRAAEGNIKIIKSYVVNVFDYFGQIGKRVF